MSPKPTADPITYLAGISLEALEKDLYGIFGRMRRECPAAYYEPLGAWFVTRWDDCQRIGGDKDNITAPTWMEATFGVSILSLDGPVHQDLRRAVDPPLRPRVAPTYNDRFVRPAVRHYIEKLRPAGRADATKDLFEMISVSIIGDIMGLSEIDADDRQRWFHTLAAQNDNHAHDERTSARAAAMREEIDEYFREKIQELTAHPDDSLLSHMIHEGTADGTPRTFDMLIGTLRVLVMGGFQEPGHAVAATLYGLLLNPDQLKQVADEPDKYVGPAIQEGLRWLPPFSTAERMLLGDVEVAGVTIPSGEMVSLAIASANRDESRFERPDQFDLNRGQGNIATFGYGLHHCSGHAVSRQLGGIVLQETLRNLPNLRLDPDNEPVVSGLLLRAVKELPVLWDV